MSRAMISVVTVMFTVTVVNAQPGVHTVETGSEVLRLTRNEKLDLNSGHCGRASMMQRQSCGIAQKAFFAFLCASIFPYVRLCYIIVTP